MNKKEQAFVTKYFNSQTKNIYDCYKTPSAEKVQIFDTCLKKMSEHYRDGDLVLTTSAKILSHNSAMFTFGYLYYVMSPGYDDLYLRVETKYNTYDIWLGYFSRERKVAMVWYAFREWEDLIKKYLI